MRMEKDKVMQSKPRWEGFFLSFSLIELYVFFI